MKIQENIRKVLREEVDKQLINKVVRRLKNIDDLILQSAEWTSDYYANRLKEEDIDWFIDTVIDGFYIDYVSPIFEDWDEGELEPDMSISDEEEEELREFFKTRYHDEIVKYYNNNFGNNIFESVSPFLRRRSHLVKRAEREAYNYMIFIYKKHANNNTFIGESDFTNMYCDIIMDELHPYLSDNGTKSFDYHGTYDEIKRIYKELIHELWKHLNKTY
jgi:hypothetical protein